MPTHPPTDINQITSYIASTKKRRTATYTCEDNCVIVTNAGYTSTGHLLFLFSQIARKETHRSMTEPETNTLDLSGNALIHKQEWLTLIFNSIPKHLKTLKLQNNRFDLMTLANLKALYQAAPPLEAVHLSYAEISAMSFEAQKALKNAFHTATVFAFMDNWDRPMTYSEKNPSLLIFSSDSVDTKQITLQKYTVLTGLKTLCDTREKTWGEFFCIAEPDSLIATLSHLLRAISRFQSDKDQIAVLFEKALTLLDNHTHFPPDQRLQLESLRDSMKYLCGINVPIENIVGNESSTNTDQEDLAPMPK